MKLCVPSYLIPGTWLENLRFIAHRELRGTNDFSWVEGIELLFFRYDDDAREIIGREASSIASFTDTFEFSVHLPDPFSPHDEELVDNTECFATLYVLHPTLAADVDETGSGLVGWVSQVQKLRKCYGDRFALEYTGRKAFERSRAAIPDMPICADTGKLLLDGISPDRWISENLDSIREIHLHSVHRSGKYCNEAGGCRDHAALSADDEWLGRLTPVLSGFEGRIEFECFSADEVLRSMNVFRQIYR
jgi:sugar phosphate isomerase/epimerase